MKTEKNKTLAISSAMLLLISLGSSAILLPSVSAHSPPWTIKSYAYLVVSPSPIGIGQTAAVAMWIDEPLPNTNVENNIRRHDYTLTITKPDGKTESKHWDVVLDTTSIQYYEFAPSQTGNYTLKFDYAGQTYTWTDPIMGYFGPEPNPWTGDVILPATKTKTLMVQEEPVLSPISAHPLPTEYWTRPIEGQNWNWYTVASNWLSAPYIKEGGEPWPMNGFHPPDATAPNTAHVMWTKPIQTGGIVGGNKTNVPGEAFYAGNSYNIRWQNPIIIAGTMFYEEPWGNKGAGGDYVAVDLRTGKEVWRINASATGDRLIPSFGYLYAFESGNQHGILPNGLLIAVQSGGWGTPVTWRAYDPRTGVLTDMKINNIPDGASAAGPRGEYLKYIFSNLGNETNPKYYLMQWNSSKVFGTDDDINNDVGTWYSGSVDASLPSAYDWNISLALSPGEWTLPYLFWQYSQFVDYNNIMLLIQGVAGGHPFDQYAGTSWGPSPAKITAISLKPESLGQVLWTKSYSAPEDNSRYLTTWDTEGGIFVLRDRHLMDINAYSLATGEKVWGPVSLLDDDFATDLGFLDTSAETVGYGKIFVAGYAGLVKAFDQKTGKLLWTYGNGGEGNSTFVGGVGPFGRTPLFVNVVADGKIFLSSTQHSPNSPLYMGYKFRALNATDGTELWTIAQYGTLMYSTTVTVADGFLSFVNNYDGKLYTIGKGPSAMTVEAPLTGAKLGDSVTIRGTVTDIAAGTKQEEQAARFPNGVPAVSDASMSEWMEYVYMQKPRPTEVTGVKVTLSVLDANNNFRKIGEATSDSNGFYSLQWIPDIPGKFTVYASFAGSESYWPSNAETAFSVDEAPSAAQTPEYPQPIDNTMTIIGVGVAILIAVAIVGAILAMMLRKRQ